MSLPVLRDARIDNVIAEGLDMTLLHGRLPWLVARAYGKLHDLQEAYDVATDAAEALFKAVDDGKYVYRSDPQTRAWLSKALGNRIKHCLRDREVHRKKLREHHAWLAHLLPPDHVPRASRASRQVEAARRGWRHAPGQVPDINDQERSQIVGRDIRDALSRLCPDDQGIALCYLNGWKWNEIGGHFDLSEDVVKHRWHRAIVPVLRGALAAYSQVHPLAPEPRPTIASEPHFLWSGPLASRTPYDSELPDDVQRLALIIRHRVREDRPAGERG